MSYGWVLVMVWIATPLSFLALLNFILAHCCARKQRKNKPSEQEEAQPEQDHEPAKKESIASSAEQKK